MTVALSSLQFTGQSNVQWTAKLNQIGFTNPSQNVQQPNKTVTLGSVSGSPANNTVGGADEVYAACVHISASGTATINLQNLTDVVNQPSMAFARVKYWRFGLLSLLDDPTNGSACTGITVGNAGSNPFLFNLGGTTPTFTIHNGSFLEYADQSAAGFTCSSANENILITNNDSVNAAGVLVIICGGST